MNRASTLAIDGGEPVRRSLLPYGRQAITEEDIAAVGDVLRSDWITTGPKVGEFEEAVADYVGATHAVAFSSGTAALHAAAFAAAIAPGDEVITTPLTFCADANVVLYQGGTPVFADIRSDTMNIDPSEVAARKTTATKAVIAVDYAGHPADLDELRELGVFLIEDASHAIGATSRGRRVGSIADITTFSFHPVKHVTTGEGGLATTEDAELARRMRIFRNHGITTEARERAEQGAWFYEMTELGFNYRLPDLACALGLAQLARLDENVAARRRIAARYQDAFGALDGVVTPTVQPDVEPAWHLYPLRLDLDRLSVGRAQVFAALRAEGLGVNVHYVPVHLHPYYRERFGYAGGEFPRAEAAYESLLSLPMFHSMTDADVGDVIAAVDKVIGHYRA